MSNLEILKQELLNQKSAIEEKGGVVSVTNINPSPSEITQGIKSIEVQPDTDLSDATATEADVLAGVTFYAGDKTLKTGTLVLSDDAEMYEHVFYYLPNVQSSTKEFEFTFDSSFTEIRPYICSENKNKIKVNFSPNTNEIGTYAFYGTDNFTFSNLSDITNLQHIRQYGFSKSNPSALHLDELPASIQTLESRAFENIAKDGESIVLSSNLSTAGSYCFACDEIKYLENFVLPTTSTVKVFGINFMENLNFNCDLTFPAQTMTISAKFNYNGSFNNVVFSNVLSSLGANAFNADSTVPLSDIKLKTVTFQRTNPPTIGATVFSSQALENGLKIYVPDESYDSYVSKLSAYSGHVFPVSQKD